MFNNLSFGPLFKGIKTDLQVSKKNFKPFVLTIIIFILTSFIQSRLSGKESDPTNTQIKIETESAEQIVRQGKKLKSDEDSDNSLKAIPDLLRFQDEKKKPLFKFNIIEPLHRKWYEAYKYLDKKYHLQLGFAYTSLYQRATTGLDGDEAAGGDFDFFGQWIINDKDSCHPFSIGFFTEMRSKFTKIPPSDLGDAIGSLWGTVSTFNQQRYSLIQLWAEYHIIRKKFGFRIGKIDLTDYFNLYTFINTNFFFLNSGLTTELSTPFPSNGLSALLAYKPTKNSGILVAIADANGDKTTLSFDTFFSLHEYFTVIEYVYKPEFSNLGKGNYNVMLWHSDARKRLAIPSGWGYALSFEQEVGGGWLPFIRYGFSHGEIKRVRQSFSTGFGLLKPFSRDNDVYGFGVTWGEARDRKKRDQFVIETYYRLQLTPHIQISPDIEIFVNPTDNSEQSMIGVFGIRFRLDM